MNTFRRNNLDSINFIDKTASLLNHKQQEFSRFINESTVSIGVGEKESGKSETALMSAILRLKNNLAHKLILTNPKLSYTDKSEILKVYYGTLVKLIGEENTQYLLDEKYIEVLTISEIDNIPSSSNSVIVLEDGYLISTNELRSVMSNLKLGDRFILMGDLNECETTDRVFKQNGLTTLIHNLHTKEINLSRIDLQFFIF